LSNTQLIKTSRDFVCIRTATYEDKQEAGFLKWAFLRSPAADLRNFGFCILSPDGKRQLRRSRRGPNYVYENSAAMAADLELIARQFSRKTTKSESDRAVPRMKSVRLGINVASCDGLPSVVVFGKSKREVDQMNLKLSGVIWDEALAGKFIYASTTKFADLKIVLGATLKTGILVVEPDIYGTKGRLIKMIDASVSEQDLTGTWSMPRTRSSDGPRVTGSTYVTAVVLAKSGSLKLRFPSGCARGGKLHRGGGRSNRDESPTRWWWA